MHLISFKAIDDPAACLFHPLRPVNVILLVESCPKLDQHRNFFPILRRGTQIFHQPGLLGQPVYGNLDGQHIRICGRLLDQAQEGIHALIRVKQQDIVLFHLLHDAAFLHMGGILW